MFVQRNRKQEQASTTVTWHQQMRAQEYRHNKSQVK